MKAVMTNRNTGHRGLRAGRAAEFTRVMAPRLGAAPTVANGAATGDADLRRHMAPCGRRKGFLCPLCAH